MEYALSHLIWQHLSVSDILTLCKSSKEYLFICYDKHTWYFLLRRDFNISYIGDDPYKEYGRQLLKILSNLFVKLGNLNQLLGDFTRHGRTINYYQFALILAGYNVKDSNIEYSGEFIDIPIPEPKFIYKTYRSPITMLTILEYINDIRRVLEQQMQKYNIQPEDI